MIMHQNVKVLSTNLGSIQNRSVYQAVRNRIENTIYNVAGQDNGYDRVFSVLAHMDHTWFNATNAYDVAHRASTDHVSCLIAKRDLDATLVQDAKDIAFAFDNLAQLIDSMVSELEETDIYTHVDDGDPEGVEREMTVYMSKNTALRWILNSRDYSEIHALFNCASFADSLNALVTTDADWTPRALQLVADINQYFEMAIRLTINASETGPMFYAWQLNCIIQKQSDPSTFRNVMEWLDEQSDYFPAQEGDYGFSTSDDADEDENA